MRYSMQEKKRSAEREESPTQWQGSFTEPRNILTWKGFTRIIKVQLLSLHRTPQESHPVPESTVQTLPELCQALCCDQCPGELFQCPATLWAKNLILISTLNFPCQNFRPLTHLAGLPNSRALLLSLLYLSGTMFCCGTCMNALSAVKQRPIDNALSIKRLLR